MRPSPPVTARPCSMLMAHRPNSYRAERALPVALALSRQGFRVVQIPVWSKHPWMQQWQCRATSDSRLIELWDGHWPGMNWCVLTGREAGLIILDIDGDEGRTTIAELECELGPLPQATWRVISGRDGGGEHIWLRPPSGTDDLSNQQPVTVNGRQYKGLDVRGWHGQTILPGSKHNKTGRRYRWADDSGPGEVELAECPRGWWEWLPKKEFEKDANTPSRNHSRSSTRRSSPIKRTHDPASYSIGDGPGYGGFNRPIRVRCCQFWARGGTHAQVPAFKDILRNVILNAPAANHTHDQIARYASDEYLTAELASARKWINSQAE